MQGKIKLVDGRSFGTKMRKALGEKKKEILPEAIDQITQLYAGAINNKELVKIYDNEDFAYIKMTVDFPLRLKWKISLTENASDNEALKHLIGQEFDSFSKLEKELQSLNFSKQQIKKFQRIFSVKNEDGEIIKKTNGDIEPNLDSRDFYYVQMPKGFFKVPNDQREKFVNDSCEAFMKDEILSHFPSAYFSVKNIKIGFEIPFVKLFYKFNNNLNPSDLGDKLEEIDNLLGQIKLELK
jgi:type I restriction enzyme M protein